MSAKWLRRLLVIFGLVAVFLVPALPAAAQTDPFGQACDNVGGAGGESDGEIGSGVIGGDETGNVGESSGTAGNAACTNPSRGGANPLLGPNGTLTKVTKFVSYIAGICAIIIIIVSGFMYVTSGGDPGKISNAKDAVLYALIGVVIAIVAQAIIIFVLNKIG
jgi:type IV secretory pathway VirB2 component (pilin)